MVVYANEKDEKTVKRNVRLVVVCVLVFSAITIVALMNKLSTPRILNKYELRDYGALILDEPQPLLDFNLLDHHGTVFNHDRLLGRWSVLFFGFTHCGDICPTTMSLLAKTYGELKPEDKEGFNIIFVTVDPERDTQLALKDYLVSYHGDFTGVTGVPRDLINFASQMKVPYLPMLGNEQGQPQHSADLVLINPKGELQGFFRPPFAHGALRVVWRSLRASYEG